NYILQAKFRTKTDTKTYVSPKDIREFAAVLMQQSKDTVRFFVSNATYLTRSKNTAINSKLNLILCNEDNIVEMIKEAQLKLEENIIILNYKMKLKLNILFLKKNMKRIIIKLNEN